MQMARSTIKIGVGRIGEEDGTTMNRGWIRCSPATPTLFLMDRPLWTPGDDIARGKHLLVMGEQGLGDEVLFANLLPDVVEALGPRGQTHPGRRAPARAPCFSARSLTADGRASRHLPLNTAATLRAAPALGDTGRFDLWTPLASLLVAPLPPAIWPRRLPARANASWSPTRRGSPTGAPVLETAPAGHKVGAACGRACAATSAPLALLFPVRTLVAGADRAWDRRSVNVQYLATCAPRRSRVGPPRPRRRGSGPRPAST